MPKITVFVPVYDVEKYIQRCLESIHNQTFQDFEIVVVNDGSPDNSEKVVLDYQKTEKRIRYFYQENQGLGEARNHGIREAKGEFICFIDSDDFIEPDYLELLYHAIEKENADVSYAGMQKVNKNGNIIETFSQTEEELWSFEQPSACNKLYRTSLFSAYNIWFPDHLLYEDLATIPKILMVSKKTVRVDKCLYNYFVNEESITQTYNKRVLEMKKVLNILQTFYLENNLKQYQKNIEYVHLYAGIINTSFRMIVSGLFSKQDILAFVKEIEKIYPNCYKNEMAKKRFPLKYRVICILIRYRFINIYRCLVLARKKAKNGSR